MSTPLNDNHLSDEAIDPRAIRLGCLVMLIGGVLSWVAVFWIAIGLISAVEAIIR